MKRLRSLPAVRKACAYGNSVIVLWKFAVKAGQEILPEFICGAEIAYEDAVTVAVSCKDMCFVYS